MIPWLEADLPNGGLDGISCRGDATGAYGIGASPSRERERGAQVRRLLVLASVVEGRCRGEAAVLSGMGRQTLCDWIHRYKEVGSKD